MLLWMLNFITWNKRLQIPVQIYTPDLREGVLPFNPTCQASITRQTIDQICTPPPPQ